MKSHVRIAALALALSAPALSAQVVISEIEFEARNGEGQWIELANLGTSSVDIGSWSVYQATLTPNTPGNYWFGFPRGTKIDAGKFLRVHWLAKVQASTATDVYTGDTVWQFLFGLFAEKLDRSRGALALMSTQANNEMNNKSKIVDWVSWGTTGFKRESFAVDAGQWTKNSAAPAVTGTPTPTLAYNYDHVVGAASGRDWFRDFTPTPGADNLGGAIANLYGTACRGTLDKIANLVVNGKPINGNKDFGLTIDRTLDSKEFALALFGIRGNGSLKLFGCPYWLDTSIPAIILVVPKVGNSVEFKIDPAAIKDIQFSTFWAIANVFDDKLGFTQGVELKGGK